MPIPAAISSRGLSWARRAMSRSEGRVIDSPRSLDGLGRVSVDVDLEFGPGVAKGIEEKLTGGPLAMQQVGPGPLLVVTDDISDDAGNRGTESGSIGAHGIGKVDGADLLENPPGLCSGQPDEGAAVSDIDDGGETGKG